MKSDGGVAWGNNFRLRGLGKISEEVTWNTSGIVFQGEKMANTKA